jgi:CDP-diglyceride synthetase
MLKARIVTAAILLALLLAALFGLSEFFWAVLMLGLPFFGGREWGALAGYSRGGSWAYGAVSALAGGFLLAGLGEGGGVRLSLTQPVVTGMLGVSLLFWLLAVPLWLGRGWHSRRPLLLALVGWIVLLPTWLALAGLRVESPWLLLGVMAVVWVADSAAYFAGRRFGKNKLAPSISPGKTWEGVGGAMIGVGLYVATVAAYSGASLLLVPAAIALTVFSIEGDLFESWMKRQAGLKDSGSIFPGHGGILDRVDALTSSLPLAALLILVLQGK